MAKLYRNMKEKKKIAGESMQYVYGQIHVFHFRNMHGDEHQILHGGYI